MVSFEKYDRQNRFYHKTYLKPPPRTILKEIDLLRIQFWASTCSHGESQPPTGESQPPTGESQPPNSTGKPTHQAPSKRSSLLCMAPCLKGPHLSTYPGIINNNSGYPCQHIRNCLVLGPFVCYHHLITGQNIEKNLRSLGKFSSN